VQLASQKMRSILKKPSTSSFEASKPKKSVTSSSPTKIQPSSLRPKIDDMKVHQLRGIFSTFDEDRDGFLSTKELESALFSLGIDPTPYTISKYQLGSMNGKVDIASFVRLTTVREPVRTTEESILTLFREFDKENTGKVSLGTVIHLLCEVDTPSSLSAADVNTLLKISGALPDRKTLLNSDIGALLKIQVDYKVLVRAMMFTP
jgi:calcium-binding protein CML